MKGYMYLSCIGRRHRGVASRADAGPSAFRATRSCQPAWALRLFAAVFRIVFRDQSLLFFVLTHLLFCPFLNSSLDLSLVLFLEECLLCSRIAGVCLRLAALGIPWICKEAEYFDQERRPDIADTAQESFGVLSTNSCDI